jgi:hypothetical protein
MFMKKILKIMLIIPLVVLAIGLFGWVTMSLWNWLIPELFNGPLITFWQALGFLVLSKILFSGIGKSGGHHKAHWKRNWKKKFSRMSLEERELFRQKFEARWCRKPPVQNPADSGQNSLAS